jgi:hypothetical protein
VTEPEGRAHWHPSAGTHLDVCPRGHGRAHVECHWARRRVWENPLDVRQSSAEVLGHVSPAMPLDTPGTVKTQTKSPIRCLGMVAKDTTMETHGMRTERCIALSIIQHWTGKLHLVAETMQPDYRCRMHSLCGDNDRIPHQCCRVHSCDYEQEYERPRSTDVRRDRGKNFTSLVRSSRRHPLSSACRVIFTKRLRARWICRGLPPRD